MCNYDGSCAYGRYCEGSHYKIAHNYAPLSGGKSLTDQMFQEIRYPTLLLRLCAQAGAVIFVYNLCQTCPVLPLLLPVPTGPGIPPNSSPSGIAMGSPIAQRPRYGNPVLVIGRAGGAMSVVDVVLQAGSDRVQGGDCVVGTVAEHGGFPSSRRGCSFRLLRE